MVAEADPLGSNPDGGMLEHAMLLLRRLDSSAVQAVVEPSTYAPLGFVRLRPRGLLESWFRRPSPGSPRTRGRIPTLHNPQQPASAVHTVGLRRGRPRRRRRARPWARGSQRARRGNAATESEPGRDALMKDGGWRRCGRAMRGSLSPLRRRPLKTPLRVMLMLAATVY